MAEISASSVESSDATLSIGKLSAAVGVSIPMLRRMADAGDIPFIRTAGGHRRFELAAVQRALAVRSGGAADGHRHVVPQTSPDWVASRPIKGLEEHLVWRDMVQETGFRLITPASGVLQYAVHEMLNNAIEHSGGTRVTVRIWTTGETLAFEIEDDGEGAFAHLRRGLGLAADIDAIGELSKGKRTTMPDRHSGEGIFFSSKVMDVFRLAANGLRWTVDTVRSDQAVGIDSRRQGTDVSGAISATTSRTTTDVFRRFTEDHGFTRTAPVVKLFDLGLTFVSRSEARRLLAGLGEFTEIELDFAGVPEVGQAFVDEVFRVWPAQHPGASINPVNMNDAVEFMIRRGLPGS